jgi:hypothetical protein
MIVAESSVKNAGQVASQAKLSEGVIQPFIQATLASSAGTKIRKPVLALRPIPMQMLRKSSIVTSRLIYRKNERTRTIPGNFLCDPAVNLLNLYQLSRLFRC